MNKNIGDMTESELKDFIIELQEENSRYERKNKKYKEVIDKLEKYIEKETRIYWLSMPTELGTHFDNILGILKEVK